ncbi:hypothetical protein Tco_1426661 [Tanacetum coccineum]
MPPRKAPRTRTTPATTTATTTPVTDKQLKILIAQGVADVLAERDATKSRNGKDSHDSRTGVRRQAPLACEMFPEESDKIERYVGGLPDMIYRSVMASKPKTMQDVIEFTIELMDKKIITFAERQAENKRKFNDTSRNNQNQQQQNKRQNTGRAYTVGSGVLQMPMLLTTKGELGQVRNLFAMSAEPNDISRGIVQK